MDTENSEMKQEIVDFTEPTETVESECVNKVEIIKIKKPISDKKKEALAKARLIKKQKSETKKQFMQKLIVEENEESDNEYVITKRKRVRSENEMLQDKFNTLENNHKNLAEKQTNAAPEPQLPAAHKAKDRLSYKIGKMEGLKTKLSFWEIISPVV